MMVSFFNQNLSMHDVYLLTVWRLPLRLREQDVCRGVIFVGFSVELIMTRLWENSSDQLCPQSLQTNFTLAAVCLSTFTLGHHTLYRAP